MANVITLFKNGGQMVMDVEEMKEYLVNLAEENTVLKRLIETQGAIIVALKDEIGVISRKLDDINDRVNMSARTTNEIKHKKFIGQEMELLDTAKERVKNIPGKDVRKLIHRAADAHPNGRRKGYTAIYSKLYEITGYDVYEVGKVRLKKSDNINGWSKDPSYINAILRDGYGEETAVICLQILADK